MYQALGDFYLRARGRWSAKGKTLPRALLRAQPEFAARFEASFATLFGQRDPSRVIALAEEVLGAEGGLLFEGYRREAPAHWRIAVPSDDGSPGISP
jgi:hypothetical protein